MTRPIVYRFDSFVLDLRRGALLSATGSELRLRPKSFALLQFMVERAGNLVSREAILQALWPNTFVVDDSITQCIRDIRRVLADHSPQQFLRTIPRRGYLFTAKVAAGMSSAPPSPARSPRAERRCVTAMFTDLQGYTSLAETLDPHLLASLLDEYLSAMIEAVLEHDGTLLCVAGDGLNVLFGAPQRQPNHAARALACALALDTCAEDFRARWRNQGVHLGITRIGVNSGPALVGSFGGHAGGYAAHGETINVASRLEAANKLLGTRICLSRSVVERLPDFRGRQSGTVALREGEPAVPVYEPRADGRSLAWEHGRAQALPPGEPSKRDQWHDSPSPPPKGIMRGGEGRDEVGKPQAFEIRTARPRAQGT